MRNKRVAIWGTALFLCALLGAVPAGAASKIAFVSNVDGDYEIYIMNPDGSGVVQLTDNAANDRDPRWSPDGSRIAFYSDRDGDNDIYVMDADGSNVVQLSNDSNPESDHHWSPDGSRIIFVRVYGGFDWEVFGVDPDGSNLTQLTSSYHDHSPQWSPDGSKIAYATHRVDKFVLFTMDADGANQTQITFPTLSGFCCPGDNHPFWSPDGSKIAYDREVAMGVWKLFVVDADGTNQVQLGTSGLPDDFNPLWSPDGSTIAFSARDGSNKYHIYLMDADGTNARALTGESANEGSHSWSPDGSQILFRSDRDGDYEIYLIDADGTDLVQLTDNSANDYPTWAEGTWTTQFAAPSSPPSSIVFASDRDGDLEIYRKDIETGVVVQLTDNSARDDCPSVSPDGTKIAFYSNRDGNGEIYVMGIDGSDPVNLTNQSGVDNVPTWSPDGARIVFWSKRSGNEEIYVMDADGGNPVNLTNHGANDWGPALSPDGTTISFASDRNPPTLVWLMDADGSNVRPLSVGHFAGGWSPDGNQLTLTNHISGNEDVYTINVDGSGYTRLTTSPVRDLADINGWSPDGSRIAFTSNRDGNYEIYWMNTDGSDQVNLTNHPANDYHVAWVPVELLTVAMPDTVAGYARSIRVPVRIGDLSGRDVVSAELFMAYDGDLLTATGVDITGTLLTPGWSVETNVVEGSETSVDTLKIAMATDDDVLAGEGTLISVGFDVADVRHPASSALELTHVLLNDGNPVAIAEDGSVTLVGMDGTIGSAPEEIVPRWSIDVTVTDVDEDRDAGGADAFDVAVTSGSQTETVVVEETGANTGVFAGSIATAFSLSFTADDGIVQAKAGDAVEFCYGDSLDSAGNTVERCATTEVIGGVDGAIRTTVVSQPGDTVRVRVIDADLDESVAVQVENPRTSEVESVVLSQFDVGDSHFYGRFFTDRQTGVAGDSTLEVAKGDVVVVTYADTLTSLGGTATRTDDDEVVDPFGDADGNGSVQAFDAARVLYHRLQTYGGNPGSLSGLDSLSANVDSLAPFGIIDGYDASLVLRQVVGLVERFQVQAPNAANHPQPETRERPKAVPEERELVLRVGQGYVSVWAEEREGIVSGELAIEGIAGPVAMGEELGDFLVASRDRGDGVQVVFAGVEAVSGPGELVRVYSGVGPGSARLTRASFNGGRIGARSVESQGMVRPLAYALYGNAPNPFNPETVIGYGLPVASQVELTVYDVVGQRVRTLVSGARAAGRHEVTWDGRDEAGQSVSSGVYFYRLEARGATGARGSEAARAGELRFTRMRRMLLLK